MQSQAFISEVAAKAEAGALEGSCCMIDAGSIDMGREHSKRKKGLCGPCCCIACRVLRGQPD